MARLDALDMPALVFGCTIMLSHVYADPWFGDFSTAFSNTDSCGSLHVFYISVLSYSSRDCYLNINNEDRMDKKCSHLCTKISSLSTDRDLKSSLLGQDD